MNALEECRSYLKKHIYYRNKKEVVDTFSVQKIYHEINSCNTILFLKLKKELTNQGWIA